MKNKPLERGDGPLAAVEREVARSSIDRQQRRSVAWDIIDQALADYDGWMLDDDYEAMPVLQRIMRRMRERRDAVGGMEE
jgi:hypothetical protein